jgi:type II secretory pathway component PulK
MCCVACLGLTGVNPNWAPQEVLARMFATEGVSRIMAARRTEIWRTIPEFLEWAGKQGVISRGTMDAKSSMLELP